MKKALTVAVIGLWSVCATAGSAISIETVPVGNLGNARDSTGYGAVGYEYNIGKYEVTAGQYTAFLNAVAKTDTYGLYNTNMDTAVHSLGCNVKRSGSAGSYVYSVASDWANRPVGCVSWSDSARFANWLHNGQPTGAQNLSTTEDGAYYLNGATSNVVMAVTRKANAMWVIPSENEWYKAAYHKNDGVTGNYFDYPTGSDIVPSNDLTNPDGGNNANFWQGGHTIDSPYYRTEVGEFENSNGPYGTFDQGGNVWEWNEAVPGSQLGIRGGAFDNSVLGLYASDSEWALPPYEYYNFGFRVAEVPEPASMAFLALGGLGMIRRKRR